MQKWCEYVWIYSMCCKWHGNFSKWHKCIATFKSSRLQKPAPNIFKLALIAMHFTSISEKRCLREKKKTNIILAWLPVKYSEKIQKVAAFSVMALQEKMLSKKTTVNCITQWLSTSAKLQ